MTKTITIAALARLRGVTRQAVRAAITSGKLETVEVKVPNTQILMKSANSWQPNENKKRSGRRKGNGKGK